jgi:Tol biopolymer transport system component
MEQADYEKVLDLCSGSFLATYDRKIEGELAHWVDAQNGRIRVGLEVASARFVTEALQEDDPKRAVKAARRYAEANPLDDAAQALLIRSLRALGRDVEALQAYETYRKLLKETLGDEPTEEMEKTVSLAREALLAPFSGESLAGGVNGHDGLIAEWLARETKSRSRRDRWLVPGLAGGMVALTVVAVGWWAWGRWANDPLRITTLDRVAAVIPVALGVGAAAEVSFDASSVRMDTLATGPLAHFRMVAPNGSRAASAVLDGNGVNIALEDLVSGEVTRLTTEAQDEYPVHWSPDSRQVLGIEGRPADDDRDYLYHLVVYDIERATRRRLSDVPVPFSEPYAAWSPSGARIAFSGRVAEGCQIFVVNSDGSDSSPASPVWEWASAPAWSPAGDRLAFAAMDQGAPHLYVVRPDGNGFHRVTSTTSSDSWPMWLSDRVLAFVSDRGGGSDLWLLDIVTDEARPVTMHGEVRRTLAYAVPISSSRWVDRVVIRPALNTVTPGQDVRFEVKAFDFSGQSVSYEMMPVRWSLSDSAIGQLSGNGRLRVRALASARLIASAGGWRADTLELVSRPLVARAIEPLLVDDWRRGILPDLWLRFGDPLPQTRYDGGPDGGGVFLNNGDDHYTSGVVSRRSFDLRNGLTVEVWGKTPFSGSQWETFMVDLFWTTPVDDGTDWRTAATQRLLTLDASGARDSIVLHGQGTASRIAFPADPSDWHLYGLQVDPGGRVRFVTDGELRWTSPWTLRIGAESAVHIGLRGSSLGAEIAHGTVRVYEGERYMLPEEGRLPPGTR